MKVRLADGAESRRKETRLRTPLSSRLNCYLWKVKFGLHAHKVKVCKKTGFLQWGTIRVFCLPPGPPSGNMPTWAGQDTSVIICLCLTVHIMNCYCVQRDIPLRKSHMTRCTLPPGPSPPELWTHTAEWGNNDAASRLCLIVGSYFLVLYLSLRILSWIIL